MKLPDGNLIIAFKRTDHPLHTTAKAFFKGHPKVVTCPITELNLVRVLMATGYDGKDADALLADFVAKHRSKLIPCDISATEISGLNNGHKQTTDTYLAKLAAKHQLTISTLDVDFAKRFPGLVELVQS